MTLDELGRMVDRLLVVVVGVVFILTGALGLVLWWWEERRGK